MSKVNGLLVIAALGLLALSLGNFIYHYVAALGDVIAMASCF